MSEVAPQTRERAKPMRLLNAARATYRLRGLDGAFTAVAVVAALFLQLLLFGGDKYDIALLFAEAELLTLCALLLLTRWSRRALALRSLAPIAVLYGAMLLCVAGEFLPFPIGVARDAYKAAGATAAITIDRFSSLIELFKLGGLGAVFMIGVALGRDDDRARNAFRAFAALAAAYSVFAIGNFELFQNGPFLGSASGRWRLNATLLSPNTAATVLAMFAVLSWTAILRALQSNRSSQDLPLDRLRELLRLSLPWCPSLILSLWALTLTGSRGGGLAACIGLAVSSISMALGGLKSRRGLRLSLLIGGGSLVGMGLVGVFLLSQGSIGSRMTFAADGLADRGMILPDLPSAFSGAAVDGVWHGHLLSLQQSYHRSWTHRRALGPRRYARRLPAMDLRGWMDRRSIDVLFHRLDPVRDRRRT